mgnify:CR=1 FL=1
MIAIQNLQKQFGKLQVLKGINIHLTGGQVVCIMGPNGSGKTTLIKCILGMVVADKGGILVSGKTIAGDYTYRNHIGYMPQIGRYPENMKIGQLISMMKDLRKNVPTTDEELIEGFALKSMYNKAMHTLSGGTTQKVSASLAFLFNPQVLILDEPTAGLDPLAAEILKAKIVKAKAQGKLVLITSHIMSEVEELADSLMYLHEGQIQFYKTIEQLKNETGEEKLGKAVAGIIKNALTGKSYN